MGVTVRVGVGVGGGVGVVGVVCRRRCYQRAMAGMVLHAGKCKPEGLCVSTRAVCLVCVRWSPLLCLGADPLR